MPVSSQMIALNIGLRHITLVVDDEFRELLAVVDIVVLSELQEEVETCGGRQMRMVNSGLRHHLEALVNWTFLQCIELGVVLPGDYSWVILKHLNSKVPELLVDDLIGPRHGSIIREVLLKIFLI